MYQGNTIEKLHEDLADFMNRTEYCVEDFEQVTFLYAKGEDDKIKDTMQYDPIRPCDQEEFVVGASKANHEPIRLGFSNIPDDIRDNIDPEFNPTCANLAFMFDEGMPSQRIYFVDDMASHTMLRLPIINVAPITHAKIQLLAENLLYLNREMDAKQELRDVLNISEAEKTRKICRPQMTVRIDDKGFKRVVGFKANSGMSIALCDYIDNFLKIAGNKILSYQADDKSWSIIVKANHGKMKHPWKEFCACYAIKVSDSGQGAPMISTGWMHEDGSGAYAQSDSHVLEAASIDKLIEELKETLGEFKKSHQEHIKEMKKLNNKKLVMDDPSTKVTIVSSIISQIPQYEKALGNKGYSALLKKEISKYNGKMSEFTLRSEIFNFAANTATADFSKKVFSEAVGAKIIGIVPVSEVENNAVSKEIAAV